MPPDPCSMFSLAVRFKGLRCVAAGVCTVGSTDDKAFYLVVRGMGIDARSLAQLP